jgi:DNA processing protein
MENFEEKACLCALGKIFGFKPKIALALIGHLGNAREVFNISKKDLELLLGPHSQYTDIIRKAAVYEAADELERYEKLDISFIGWTEEHYPALLKECPDAPIGLYVRSRTHVSKLWTPKKSIAVVGTRDISPYGKEWCAKTVFGLASSSERPAIVSGLALGTDICAHKAALEAGLPTIAVMATGLEKVYPWRHQDFAEKLVHTNGCALVTDYPPGTAPLAIHFLRRNRIIAGLSRATLLMESKIRGGGMMTCRLAFSYGREVYALPGRVDDLRSQGCNLLIREKIAEPLTSPSELIKSLGFGRTDRKNTPESDLSILKNRYSDQIPKDRIDQMAAILLTIRKHRGITIEEIADKTALGYSRTADLVRILETDGFISTDLLQRCTMNFRNNM